MNNYFEELESEGDEYYEFLKNMGSSEARLFNMLEVSYKNQNPCSRLKDIVNYYVNSMQHIAKELYDRGSLSIGEGKGNFILTEVNSEGTFGYRVIFSHEFNSARKRESIVLNFGTTLVDYLLDFSIDDPKNGF